MNTKKLRIAIVVGTFPTVSETFIVNQLNAFKALGHEVFLFSFHRGSLEHLHPSITQHAWEKKVQYPPVGANTFKNRLRLLVKLVFTHPHRTNWPSLLRSVNPLRHGKKALNLRVLYQAYWWIKNKPFDIVHVHFGPNAERVGELKDLGFLYKEKLVATFHGFDLVENRIASYVEQYRNIWKYFDALTVNTPYLEGILKSIETTLPPVFVLPMGLDTQYFQPTESNKEQPPFILLFCGRLIPLKGVDLAIRAVAALKQKEIGDIQLRIIGEGPMALELQELTQSLKVEKEVQLLGAMNQAAVKKEMDQAHVLLMPGKSDPKTGRAETQGLVIQEAQAMGLPVIVSDVGGMHYGMLDGETGYVFTNDRFDELVHHIIELKNEPALYKLFSKNAREHMVKNYDYRILGQQCIALFHELIAQ